MFHVRTANTTIFMQQKHLNCCSQWRIVVWETVCQNLIMFKQFSTNLTHGYVTVHCQYHLYKNIWKSVGLVLISKENGLLNVACMWQILNYLCKQNHMSDFYTLWYERSVL